MAAAIGPKEAAQRAMREAKFSAKPQASMDASRVAKELQSRIHETTGISDVIRDAAKALAPKAADPGLQPSKRLRDSMAIRADARAALKRNPSA